MRLNIPNLLTWLRILLIPLFVGIFYVSDTALSMHHKNLLATSIFAVAAITDWLDGYLARTLNQTSAFGAFLDPVADKLMVVAALIILVWLKDNQDGSSRVNMLIAFIIIGREIAVSALREWMAKIGAAKSVAVSFLGKIKTISQMAAILLLLYHGTLLGVIDAQLIGTWCIYIAAILTLWSMVYYLKKAVPQFSTRV
ncbi:MAG TPA: CDP-diacylglycerol--glycerol-3-phosphate 3-phosphatidyltransferase [Burkholderiales bacterium]|nr:CDP-diacylglycerol--glycerol-3-phosphate 3-phosphatidyltransferase [Burkholderiales bacterium]